MSRDELLKLLVKFLAISMGQPIAEVVKQLNLIGQDDLFSQQISMKDLRFAIEGVGNELNIDVFASSYSYGRVTLDYILQLLGDAWVKKYTGNSANVAADLDKKPGVFDEMLMRHFTSAPG